jgi:hypothetical protein
MFNLKNIFHSIKENFLSFIWIKAITKEDKQIKRCEWIIAICVVFMVIYMGIYYNNLKNKFESSKDHSIITPQIISTNNPNYNVAINLSTNSLPPITATNLPPGEFFIGEIVGIKYFGIYGLVINKTTDLNGYKYTVQWENQERDLPTDDFYNWQLFRPKDGTVPVSELVQ